MPTVDVDYYEFERLLGMKLSKQWDRIDDILSFVKGEAKLFDEKEGTINVEIKDTNRPDLWNIEGLVRALRGFLGLEEGLKEYKIGKELAEIHVDQRLEGIRPYIGCSIVKNLKLTDSMIRGFVRMQDKLDQTYGRNRRRTSIGLYNLDLIKPPLWYTVAKPDEVSFVPLGFTEKMSLGEILTNHPKGREYGHIVSRYKVCPILLDAENKPLSFPPIINSNDLGRITEDTRNILVEVTGTMEEPVLDTLKIVTTSLIDRGGEAHASKIHYPHRHLETTTPNFDAGRVDLKVDYVNNILGLRLQAEKIAQMLRKAGHGAKQTEKNIVRVQIPCYRIDLMHPIDLVEDVAISYNYNNIKPVWREMPTIGQLRPEQGMVDIARELMVGLGFQEVLTFTLTNPENLFRKMKCKKERIIEILNPKVNTLTCLRDWLLPSLIEFVSNNLHVKCPQKLFEMGKVTFLDEERETRTRDEDRLAAVIYDSKASLTEVKSTLEAFMMNFGLECRIKETEHPSFIKGRVGEAIVEGTEVGILGEISPAVLENWKLENPTAALELDIEKVINIKQRER
jgi:phenylalanyl-tRNA synthetase beta chain